MTEENKVLVHPGLEVAADAACSLREALIPGEFPTLRPGGPTDWFAVACEIVMPAEVPARLIGLQNLIEEIQ